MIHSLVPQQGIPRYRLREATFELPLPPSVDQMYTPIPFKKKDGTYGTRFISSQKLRDFQRDAGNLLLAQGIRHPDWEQATVLGYEAWIFTPSRRSDVSNRCKSVEDLIASILFFNDNRFEELHVYRRIDKANPHIEINLYILEMHSPPRSASRLHVPRKGAALAGNA